MGRTLEEAPVATEQPAEVEHCWPLVGKIGDSFWWAKKCEEVETAGTPVSVAFNADWVLEREKAGEGDPDFNPIVGFIHTHPGMTAYPSSRDDRTMSAWCDCLGRDLLCLIRGVDGLRVFIYPFMAESPEPAWEWAFESVCEELGDLFVGSGFVDVEPEGFDEEDQEGVS